jgi:cell wall-associated NlpC family hydrolase
MSLLVRRRTLVLGGALAAVVLVAAAIMALVARPAPARATARIAPVESPLPVPPVLQRAADRLELAARHRAAARRVAVHVPRADDAPAPTKHAASVADEALPTGGDAASDTALARAEVLANGVALPPLDAPDEVRAIIEAGNLIARTPYKWGGGHGRWLDTGYDCSGSVSFALASAGLLSGPLDSGRLMRWGLPGHGRWITVWSSPTHVFLEVAGVRFDTGGQHVTGSRWQPTLRPHDGFVARHPQGL